MKAHKVASLIVVLAVLATAVPMAAIASPARQQEYVWAAYEGREGAPGGLERSAVPEVPIGWILQPPSPNPHMDSAVNFVPGDGGLWVVSGLWAGGAQRYDPNTLVWTVGAAQPWPAIREPTDGCVGRDANNHWVVVLFPDTSGFVVGQLQVYDVTANAWTYWPLPLGFPANGQWASDIVSMSAVAPDNDDCYISGGATQGFPGGGNISTLWRYNTFTNTIVNLGNYTHIPGGFNWHVSWYVPWVGQWGGICVGGGVDWNLVLWPTTQCYDIAAGIFLPPNVPLGPLPLPLGGAADGFKFDASIPAHQIWLMNGLDPNLNHWALSAWADPTTGGFVVGPAMAAPTYRTEGDGVVLDYPVSHVYAEGGSFQLFNPQPHNQFLVQQPIQNSSHVARMKINKAPAARPGLYKIVTSALIHDQNCARLTGGSVSGDYTYPDGSVNSMTATLNALGQVKFPIKTNLLGAYTFCITGINVPGYPYNPAQNHPPFNPPCVTIAIP